MDYGRLMSRAWTILVEHKFLIILGVIVALTNGGAGSGSSYQVSSDDFGSAFGTQMVDQFEAWMGVAIAAVAALIVLGFMFFLLVWAASQIASGGLIAAVNAIENGSPTSLSESWRQAWQRKWTLIGIGLVVFLPLMLLILTAVGGALLMFLPVVGGGFQLGGIAFGGMIAALIGIACLLIPIVTFIIWWSDLAFRACLLESTGVWESYARAWRVLLDNLGPVIVLILIRFGVGLVLFIPALVAGLCCLLWPLLVILQGAVTAYFSTLVTLAWREWTAVSPATQIEAAPESTV